MVNKGAQGPTGYSRRSLVPQTLRIFWTRHKFLSMTRIEPQFSGHQPHDNGSALIDISCAACRHYVVDVYAHMHVCVSKFNFNPLNTKRRLLYLKTQFVPRSKHFSSRL